MRRGMVIVACGLVASCATPASSGTPHASPSVSAASIDAALTAAGEAMFSNRYSAADAGYRALLLRAPRSAPAHAEYALFLNYRHDFEAAAREAALAARLDPRDGHAAAILCRVDDWSQMITPALSAGHDAVTFAPSDPLGHLFLAEALADSGDTSQAQREIDAAGALIAQHPSTYLRAEQARERANLAGDTGDMNAQVAALRAARDAQPSWVYRAIELVDAELGAKDTKAATQDLDAAAALTPDDAGALRTLGEEAFFAGDAAVLVSVSTRAVALAPHDPQVLDMAGAAAVAAKQDINAAIADFQAALAVDPEDGNAAAYILAIARYVQQDEAAGRQAIERGVLMGVDDIAHGQRPRAPNPDDARAADAAVALDAVNKARSAAGLPAVHIDARLSASAESHSYYWLFNILSPTVVGLGIHQETPGLLGFSGRFPWTRAPVFGYPNGRVGEDITHRGDSVLAVADWVNSVFHRFPIMRPDLVAIGFGDGEIVSLQMEDMEFGFGAPVTSTPVAYPGKGQRDVPAIFVDNELPDPVPAGKPRTTGYPVTVTFPAGSAVHVSSFTLTDPSGTQLGAYLLDPSGSTENSASLLPVVPLMPSTTYTAHISATVDGAAYDRVWTFSTAA